MDLGDSQGEGGGIGGFVEGDGLDSDLDFTLSPDRSLGRGSEEGIVGLFSLSHNPPPTLAEGVSDGARERCGDSERGKMARRGAAEGVGRLGRASETKEDGF